MGLAIGDAVGTALEFRTPGTFEPITDLIGGGPFSLEAGKWTDDTSMALCLASSLIRKKGFDPNDQMDSYCRWWHNGFMSSKGKKAVDIGGTTVKALMNYERTGNPYAGSMDEMSAGNGSLMRLAPVVMLYYKDPLKSIEYARLSSITTHAHVRCQDSCRFFSGLLVGALQGRTKRALLSRSFAPIKGYWASHELDPEVLRVASGSYKRYNPPHIAAKGYVVKCLEASLWAFHRTDNFRDGCLRAVNLGEDADTVGAIFGQIAGAYYGAMGIPQKWKNCLYMKDDICKMADEILSISQDL